EARVRLALQAGEVEQQGRGLGRRSGFLADRPGLPATGRGDRLRPGAIPDALGARFRVLALAKARVVPAPGIGAGGDAELRVDLEVGPGYEAPDLLLALDDDRQRRGLDPADGGQVEAAVA